MTDPNRAFDRQTINSLLIESKNLLDDPKIWERVAACSGDFMCVRDILKSTFDLLENQSNEKFIGILECAFVQEVIDGSHSMGDLDISSIADRFFSNRDVVVLIGPEGDE